ncbi:LlaJI family restriction endonuclease [Paracoccus sp. JM45]|uniref:LlaJI family restriction endonuclease n=1 Tax=Paracoccus sp. JM45 TaxID=2283626 RepID=UPI0015FF2EEE|nr:LlaJI family restriction endonuclease [Paracoccus sp. JM45]
MRPNFPVFLSDRDPIAAFDRHSSTVLTAMRERGIGRVDQQKTVHYCGLIHHPEQGAVVFLPREARTGNLASDLETASLTMRALARFGAETSKRDFEDDGEAGNPGALSVIKRLADDFRDHGLFSKRIRQPTRNSGKPDWAGTVKRELAMPGYKGQPVFTDIRTSRATRSTDAILTQIQAAVVREIHLAHGWWLSGISSRRQELLLCLHPPFPRTTWARKLDTLLPSLYSARSIFLAEYLRSYLRETRKSSGGAFVFGVSDFHAVWETMLRETILRSPHDKRRNWNSELPKPVYTLKDSGMSDARSRGMQTDIILDNATNYMIVDAKYYAAKDAVSAPGWPDIAKQIFYEHALREIVDSTDMPQSIIHNIFAFPAKMNEGPLVNVEVRHEDGRPVSAAFRPVYCIYVSMREVLEHYVNNTQGVTIAAPLHQPIGVA